MVSHLTRAAILICVLMLICVLFLCKMSVYIMFNHYIWGMHIWQCDQPYIAWWFRYSMIYSSVVISFQCWQHMYTCTSLKLPFQSYAVLQWKLSDIFPKGQMDEYPTYELIRRWNMLIVSITTNTHWLLRSIKSVSWTNYLAWLWTIALKIKEFWIYWFCLVLYTILQAQSFIVQDKKSKCRKRAGNDQSFNSHEWPRQNFSLQYQADKPQD